MNQFYRTEEVVIDTRRENLEMQLLDFQDEDIVPEDSEFETTYKFSTYFLKSNGSGSVVFQRRNQERNLEYGFGIFI